MHAVQTPLAQLQDMGILRLFSSSPTTASSIQTQVDWLAGPAWACSASMLLRFCSSECLIQWARGRGTFDTFSPVFLMHPTQKLSNFP
jgi:hypothetical protein